MAKFVYAEFEGKDLDGKSIVLEKGYLNIDYIVSILMPFKYRKVELHTGCIDEIGSDTGTKYYTLTRDTFKNLLIELGIEVLESQGGNNE